MDKNLFSVNVLAAVFSLGHQPDTRPQSGSLVAGILVDGAPDEMGVVPGLLFCRVRSLVRWRQSRLSGRATCGGRPPRLGYRLQRRRKFPPGTPGRFAGIA